MVCIHRLPWDVKLRFSSSAEHSSCCSVLVEPSTRGAALPVLCRSPADAARREAAAGVLRLQQLLQPRAQQGAVEAPPYHAPVGGAAADDAGQAAAAAAGPPR